MPTVIKLVDDMYPALFDQARRGRRSQSIQAYRLVTAILSLSKKEMFIASWTNFLDLCLTQLKNNRSENRRFNRAVLDCVSRLIYVACLRYSDSEKSSASDRSQPNQRVAQIFKTLFPSSSKTPVPKDAPPGYFVKLLYYVSIKKLDQVMKQIYELMEFSSLDSKKPINLERADRMNIGLRSYLYISDHLRQKKDIEKLPVISPMPSGPQRSKDIQLTNPMTKEEAQKVGLWSYYAKIHSLYDKILLQLDKSIGKRCLSWENSSGFGNSSSSSSNLKEIDKCQLVLYETCIANIPVMTPFNVCGISDIDISLILCRAFSQNEVHYPYIRLKDKAIESFKILMINRKTIREDMVVTICNYFIDHVDSNNYELLVDGVRLVRTLMQIWLHEAKKDPRLENKPETMNNFGITAAFNSEKLPEIKDGVEPNPDLHGPKSTASFALKRIQSFCLALLPCWLNYIPQVIREPKRDHEREYIKTASRFFAYNNVNDQNINNSRPGATSAGTQRGGGRGNNSNNNNNENYDDEPRDTNFLYQMYQILELCRDLQETLNLKPFGDRMILDVLDQKFKYLVSTGQISEAIGKKNASHFRHNEIESLLSYFEYHIINCKKNLRGTLLQRLNILQQFNLLNQIDDSHPDYESLVERFKQEEIYREYDVFAEVLFMLLKSESMEMAYYNINTQCSQTMLFLWRDLFHGLGGLKLIIIYRCFSNNIYKINIITVNSKIGTHYLPRSGIVSTISSLALSSIIVVSKSS